MQALKVVVLLLWGANGQMVCGVSARVGMGNAAY